jgi:molybdopterin converting factor subunit 1
MHITVRLFSILRERAGRSELSLEVSKEATIAEALKELRHRVPELKDHLHGVAYALNHAYTQPNTPLQEGDELALIPPVSGG